MAGMGYTLFKDTGRTLGAKYYYGFVNVLKSKPGTKNISIFLQLNILIGAGEGAKQKAAKKKAKKPEKQDEKKKNEKYSE